MSTRTLVGIEDPAGRAREVMDVIERGGLAIIPLDVAYGIVGNGEDAIRRIFAAKNRSYEKPSGMFSNWSLFNEIQICSAREREVVRAVIFDHDLPLSTVAPYRADHPIFRGLSPFVVQNSSKAGTIDMLLNAGDLHDAITQLAHERLVPVLGSSANTSLAGSKYRLEDIEAPVRAAADIAIDGGTSKYHNTAGRSSTIIELPTFRTLRVGVCYEAICDVLQSEFGIDLRAIAAA